MALTWPQFQYISCNVRRLAYWRARDEVCFGICAALGDEKTKKNLMESAGSIIKEPAMQEYTQEMLADAEERMRRIIDERKGNGNG